MSSSQNELRMKAAIFYAGHPAQLDCLSMPLLLALDQKVSPPNSLHLHLHLLLALGLRVEVKDGREEKGFVGVLLGGSTGESGVLLMQGIHDF